MSKLVTPKNHAETYLYSMGDYEKDLIQFLMNSERIPLADDSCSDIRYSLKKEALSISYLKILNLPSVHLCIANKPLYNSFKTFVAKDPTDSRPNNSKPLSIFIDCTDIIRKDGGVYKCTGINMDILNARLISAMIDLIYYNNMHNTRLLTDSTALRKSMSAFAKLFTHVLDHLFKITNIPGARDRCMYIAAKYYGMCHLKGFVSEGTVNSAAKQIASISDREISMIDIKCGEDAFNNIRTVIEFVSEYFKLTNLNLDNFIEKWVFLYKSGTQFATEYYPALASMLTNAYVGCRINNDKSIEKLCGQELTDFTRKVFSIGESVLNGK